METVRQRLWFGRKNEVVKLRRRKSQLYVKDDECPLSNGELRVAVFCVTFRLINCFLVQTSFVPDEYWQSLEVSHHMVFNYGYLTWEWREGIRGFTYPLVFALIYKTLHWINCDTVWLLIWAPRLVQSLLAALADVKFFLLVRTLEDGDVAKWTFFCHLCSWFSWYCCTRTLTNSMETTITCLALFYFPLGRSKTHSSKTYLSLVALAVVIRPTALIVWIPLLLHHFWQEDHKVKLITHEYIPIGSAAVVISTLIDCVFYKKWTFVQLNFMKFNIFYGVADFYGSHPWHWYLTQGFVVVIGPHLPFFLHGCSLAFRKYKVLLVAIVWTLLIYSLLPHKEFRFIYPLLPFCMIFCGVSVAHMKKWRRRPAAAALLVTNLLAALYTGLVHQRGTLDVMGHLQTLCDSRGVVAQADVLFLMPCHSTPFYSALLVACPALILKRAPGPFFAFPVHIHCPLKMRFLQCPPNLGEDGYEDEAETFYTEPLHWLRTSFPDKYSLPTHLVLFDVLEKDISTFLEDNNFVKTAEIFHTHFPEGRVGGNVFIYKRH